MLIAHMHLRSLVGQSWEIAVALPRAVPIAKQLRLHHGDPWVALEVDHQSVHLSPTHALGRFSDLAETLVALLPPHAIGPGNPQVSTRIVVNRRNARDAWHRYALQ